MSLLTKHPLCFLRQGIFWNLGLTGSSKLVVQMNARNLPVSASIALSSVMYPTMPRFSMGAGGQTQVSCLHRENFTEQNHFLYHPSPILIEDENTIHMLDSGTVSHREEH